MDDFYFSVRIDEELTLCLAPLTQRRMDMSGDEVTDQSGYFLFEKRGGGESAKIDIIARALNDDGVVRLKEMFGMV